jgi:hypothetical protein
MYNIHHFDVKLALEFFNTELIICITMPDNPGEDLKQMGFKIWPHIGHCCPSWY